ncbi:hypothetical protein D9757_000852 [Collybiopsis confluens]|uniref:Cytochrome P450 n=1 Tax=Collybiopsis confluens TaxID=2823264 RepID=A0A8H5I0I6_9AGAR|nr:hypothetical protein D9757_000852 [Collybiopsis confluens]
MPSTVANLLAFGVFLYVARRLYVRYAVQRGLPLPPGPRGLPIIGNLFDLPRNAGAYLEITKMAEEYQTDLLYFNVVGTPYLILNTQEAATDLFVSRAANNSDRPPFPMAYLMGLDSPFVFAEYGESWRKQRNVFQQEAAPASLDMYMKPAIHENLSALLYSILENPDKYDHHIHRHFAGTILSVAFGITKEDPFDYLLDLSIGGMQVVSDTTVFGSYIVDHIPALIKLPAWFPGLTIKKEVAQRKPDVDKMMTEPMMYAKKKIENGKGAVKSSMASRQLQQMQDEGTWSEKEEWILANALGSMYAAGSDTMSSTVLNLILAFVLYPEVQKKAHAVIEAAIGSNRLPELSDEHRIPYMDALVMELLRWKPISPLPIAHQSTEADVYKGYYIPKGTVLVTNTWAILQNPAVYGEDVADFRPERFLKADGTVNNDLPYPGAFGWGKRSCPGKNIATSAIWMTSATLIAAYEFTRGIDAKGNPIIPSAEILPGLLAAPKPFKCNIKPRSKPIENMIRQKKVQHDLSN